MVDALRFATLKPARKTWMTRIGLALTPAKMVRHERNASRLTATEDTPVPIVASKGYFALVLSDPDPDSSWLRI